MGLEAIGGIILIAGIGVALFGLVLVLGDCIPPASSSGEQIIKGIP